MNKLAKIAEQKRFGIRREPFVANDKCIMQGKIHGRNYFIKQMHHSNCVIPYFANYYCAYIQTDGYLPSKFEDDMPFETTYHNCPIKHSDEISDYLKINCHRQDGYYIGFDTAEPVNNGLKAKECRNLLMEAEGMLDILGY